MLELFRARVLDEQQYQALRAPFRRKFFADNCHYDSHANTLRRLESERVVEIQDADSDPKVVSEQILNYSGGIRKMRLRYHLQRRNDNWLIRAVQNGCFLCEGRGDRNCPRCKGKQWLDIGDSETSGSG